MRRIIQTVVAAIVAICAVGSTNWMEAQCSVPDISIQPNGAQTKDSHQIVAGGSNVAQIFLAPGNGCVNLTSATISLKKDDHGNLGDILASIYTTTLAGGVRVPDTMVSGSVVTVLKADVGTTFGDEFFDFSPDVELTPGLYYAVVLSQTGTGNASNKYNAEEIKSNVYADGETCWSNGGSWTCESDDADGWDLKMTLTFACCAAAPGGCTYTQGFWKNHPGAWPALPGGVLMLGSVAYNQAELLAIFDQQPQGNGLVSLAHQLIAAKLNILVGADGSAVAATIAAADTLIGGLVVPPGGAGYLDPAVTDPYTSVLDAYNNGLIGPGHCD